MRLGKRSSWPAIGPPAAFRLLVGAYAVTSYGSYLNMIALNLFVYQVTGSALAMGVFLVLRLASGAVAGLVAGALVARVARKWIMLVSNLAQAAVLLALIVAPADLRLAALGATAVISGSASTLFLVALRSAVPDLVGQDRRDQANSLVVIARSLAMVAGFASAGLIVSWWGYLAAFVIDAGTFLLCAAAVALLPPIVRTEETGEPASSAAAPRRLLPALGAVLGAVLALRAVDAFGSSSHNVALPVYSELLDPANPAVFASTFLTCWALGNIVVQPVLRRAVRRRGRSVGPAGFAAATALMSAAFILGFAGFPLAVTVAIALVAGAADGMSEVSYVSYLQALPGRARDQAFGLSATAENVGFGLGMLGSSFLLDAYSPFAVVATAHGVPLLFSLLCCAWLLWRARNTGGRTTTGYVEPSHRDHRHVTEISGS